MIRVGCSGWNYASWRAEFYPKGMPASRWLEHYASVFDTVEVNATFYRLARHEAVANWVRQTPDDFCFAVKASRYMTHVKRLRELPERSQRFYEPLQPLADAGKLGPVLWQLPANFHRDDERLRCALEQLSPGRHTFEFRHASWFVPEVMALLRDHGVALTIADRPDLSFQTHEITADFTYVRFHHGRRGRRGNYADSELEEWARRIVGWERGGLDVYAYFNNDWEVFAPRNATRLRRLVAST
ncbi:MAG: hypothetical protein QOG15_825 [Solirubrobacteraceae bacterium]|jgi:uncharacterized protein YecE (DUF72 family)|nr:hypothetical protein [Solirubrobacteraceae bacterium]